MRVRKISALALVAVAAGLSLTACNGTGTNGASASTSSAAATDAAQLPADSTGSTGSTGSNGSTQVPSVQTAQPVPNAVNGQGVASKGSSTGGGSGSGTHAGGSTCHTANLSFSSSHGMAEGEFLINLTNAGSASCTMHGFPGVDLKGNYGTVSAKRSGIAAPSVTLRSGESTRFTLHYPPNNSGGSGVTFTSLIITPPNETHSHVLPLAVNIPASNSAGPAITVDPVGAGK